ncbi:MAG: hypothetical protein K2W85_13225 [Phycisphaerales bacterium]|nr:hypothetical protein [Phycisphaerales bacterium]
MGRSGIPLSALAPDAPADGVGAGAYESPSEPGHGASATLPARRRARSRAGVPLLVSALIHAGLLMALGTVVWHTTVAPSTVSGLIHLSFENPGDGPLAAGSTGAPIVASAQDAEALAGSGSLEPLFDAPAEVTPLTGLSSPTSALAAAGPSTLSGAVLNGGFLISSLSVGTGGVAVAGLTDGGKAVTFGGLGASSVRSVVYVVDGSGPMVTSLPIVLAELERSVSRLSPTQRFGVVIFRRLGDGSPAVESFAPSLMRATPSARVLLRDWLAAVEPAGRSNPLSGLEAALALQPDAIFLLSRAIQRSGGGVWDAGPEATLARLDQLNPMNPATGRRPVLIQTIQFLDEDPTGTMQAIAAAHTTGAPAAVGYRVVREQADLQAETKGVGK